MQTYQHFKSNITHQHHCYYDIESLTDDLDRDVISVAIPFELCKFAHFCYNCFVASTSIGVTSCRRGNKWRRWSDVYTMGRSIPLEHMTMLSNCLSKSQFL